MTTISATDTQRALAHHISGDEYIVERVGPVITGVCGPISHADLPSRDDKVAVLDAIDAIPDSAFDDVDAAWLQSEADAGRVTYPLGAR